jgi:signal transduction histidine kinase
LEDLRDRDSLKTQFLSNIAHDLRTPLTAIITHAEILRDGLLGEMNGKQRESVGTIITGGRQLLDMIAEILLYAKGVQRAAHGRGEGISLSGSRQPGHRPQSIACCSQAARTRGAWCPTTCLSLTVTAT